MSENKGVTTDSLGRTISFRKLNALDRLRLFEALGADLTVNNFYLGYALTAACVTDVNGQHEAFPLNKRAVESLVMLLGDEGLDAVAKAYGEAFRAGETGDLAAIKN